jgi:hypothetical protein
MRWAMRIFGAASILVSLFGLYFFAWLIQIHLGKWRGNPTHQDWGVFFAISAVSTLLVLCVTYLGVRLILGDLKAIWQIGCVFLMEIVFFYVDVCVTWLGMPDSKAVISVSFWGIAMTPCRFSGRSRLCAGWSRCSDHSFSYPAKAGQA